MKRACIAGILGGIVIGMCMFYGAEYHLFHFSRDRGGHNIQQTVKLRQRKFPGAIIIGVRKGGTRALLNMLKLHPDIASAGGEVHFFDRNATYKRGLEWYRKRMPSTDKLMTIEKTPAYFVVPTVPERVYKFSAKIKLILIVRDPVERTISDYTQLDFKKKIRMVGRPSFEEMVFDATGNVKEKVKIIRVSLYDVHFKRWLRYFKREQIHIVNGDAFIKNPFPELQKVERFLQVKQFYTQSMFVYNKKKGFYCWRKQVKKAKGAKSTRGFSGPKSTPTLTTVCLGASKGREHPLIAKETSEKLKVFFKPHMNRFYQLAQQTFAW